LGAVFLHKFYFFLQNEKHHFTSALRSQLALNTLYFPSYLVDSTYRCSRKIWEKSSHTLRYSCRGTNQCPDGNSFTHDNTTKGVAPVAVVAKCSSQVLLMSVSWFY